MYGHLHDNGYIGRAGVEDDFYDSGLANDRFEEEMMENEMRRRMMMESAVNLEVDLSSLGLDEQAEVVPFQFPSDNLTYPGARRGRRGR